MLRKKPVRKLLYTDMFSDGDISIILLCRNGIICGTRNKLKKGEDMRNTSCNTIDRYFNEMLSLTDSLVSIEKNQSHRPEMTEVCNVLIFENHFSRPITDLTKIHCTLHKGKDFKERTEIEEVDLDPLDRYKNTEESEGYC